MKLVSKHKNSIIDGIINAVFIDLLGAYSVSKYLISDSSFQIQMTALFFAIISCVVVIFLCKKMNLWEFLADCLVSAGCCMMVLLLNLGVLLCGGSTFGQLIFPTKALGPADGLMVIIILAMYLTIILLARVLIFLVKIIIYYKR